MKNKLAIIMLLLPVLAQANQVSLDSLVSNQNNFCNQGQDGNIKGVLSFLNLNNNSDLSFKGFKVTRIEIKNPKITLQYSPEKLKEESKKYVSSNKAYQFKNLYSINYLINFIVDTPVENIKSKVENMNASGVAYKKFGEYKGSILEQSKSLEDFESKLKTIQTPEYTMSIMSNYETNTPKSSLVYQCSIISYTSDDINTITQKASQ